MTAANGASNSALGRLIRRSTAPTVVDEHCELCDVPLPPEHRHVLDLQAPSGQGEELRCTCRACALLFEREAAGRGHYRLVPQRRVALDPGDDPALPGVPVGLAFCVVRADGSVQARYPSPVGATTWELDDAAWADLVGRWPPLRELAVDVEALLVYTARGNAQHWIVPIDDCYRLVAVIREHWTGLSGGTAVWPAVDSFFAGLAAPVRGRITAGRQYAT